LLPAKQAQVHAEKICTKKSETLPVTFPGSLCKIHTLFCSKIADVRGIEVLFSENFPIFIA